MNTTETRNGQVQVQQWKHHATSRSRALMAFGLWSVTATLVSAQTTPPIDYPARVQSVEKLKNYIAQREARFETLKQDLLAMDGRVEKQIEDIISNLSSLKDSNDSRTRVANMKEDVIEGLMRTIWNYKQKRAGVFERMRKESNIPPEVLNKNMKTFDDRIAKRLQQVMELAKSTPGHQDLNKYESYGDSYYNGYHHENSRVSEDWKQNRRDGTSGETMRREVLQEIEKALERNESQRRSIADILANRKLSDAEKALQQQELGRLDAAIDTLESKRRELVLPSGGATHEIGGDEARDAEQMLDDARRDLSRDFSDIMRSYAELDAERTRIFDMKKNLALREQWLKDNPPPTK